VCATASGGRLYCCTSGGDVVVSHAGNALVEAHRRSVLGARPLALAVVTHPLWSGGFGRYPVYVFTDDGIYAIPQSATLGTLGEARLVDRTVIDSGVTPVEGGGDIWLVSRHGDLCRLSGAKLTVVRRSTAASALAWCNAYRELWLLMDDGYPLVMLPSGRCVRRTVDATALYSDPRHALAVTTSGQVVDLEQEQPATMPVVWQSHPLTLHPLLAMVVQRAVWHVMGEDLSLTLTVSGQRAILASQSQEIVTMQITGNASLPLATPLVHRRARTLTLSATGTAPTGTMLLSTLLWTIEPKR